MNKKITLSCKICGHTKKDHQYPGETKWVDSYCALCGTEDCESYSPICSKFVSDNLKMLEDLSDNA